MAAGLGFKDFVTGEVLTAADVDGYLMQGIWVFASAAARSAAVTSPQEGNYSYLKDTNSTEYYTGSAWVSAGGGASGGLTLINTGGTSLSGASVTISSIPGTYKNLFIVVDKAYVADDSGNPAVYIKFNGDGGANYTYQTLNSINTTVSARGDATNSSYEISARISDQTTDIKKTFMEMLVRNYTNTDGVGFSSSANAFNTSEQPCVTIGAGSYDGAAAITSVNISTGSTFSGGTIFVYGVN
jgi:hypothetical protein